VVRGAYDLLREAHIRINEHLKTFVVPLRGLKVKRMNTDCSICLENVKDSVKLSNCGHIFCRECISQWVLTKKTCPNCRTVVSSSDKLTVPCIIYTIVISGLSESDRNLLNDHLDIPIGLFNKVCWTQIMETIGNDKVLIGLFRKLPNITSRYSEIRLIQDYDFYEFV
jgi:hypothetical protein